MNVILPFILLHVSCAIASPVLFSLRAWRAIRGRDPAQGFLRVTPHVIDTVLVLVGLVLASLVDQWPFLNGWLTAKVIALIAYIGVGHFAVRRARSTATRVLASLLALALIGYVFCVALTRDPTLHFTAG